MSNIFRIALAQLSVTANKAENILRAVTAIKTAAEGGANIISLPECFNSPYGTSFFPEYAEEIPGESTTALSQAAKKYGVYVIGGSIPERSGTKIYNTCTAFDPFGNIIGKHRKVHLFDINIPGKITFRESETLSPGDNLTIIDTVYGKIGLGICYDMRFPEMAYLYANKGCKLIVYPGAFNMTTGPAHWELLQRARALDNQMFIATCSPARDEKASYQAWGHSSVINPWGVVIATTDHAAGVVFSDIDFEKVDEVRAGIPIRNQRRDDLYNFKGIGSFSEAVSGVNSTD